MSRIIACDTGPRINLNEAGVLELMRQAGDILIPPAVEKEFLKIGYMKLLVI